MPTVSAGGAEVAYGVAGSGPGLVLVHGTGASADTTWGQVVPRLTDDWTVVTPDLAGSGDTVDDGGPLELGDLADQVAGAAAAAGLGAFALAGFAGGAVAAELAAAHPDQVSALVLVAPAESGAGARGPLQFGLWGGLHATDPSLFAKLWMLSGFSPAFVDSIPVADLDRAATFPIASGLERQCDLNARIDLAEPLRAIRARTLVLGCTHDWIVPPDRARAIASAIDGAAYEEIDSGHMAVLEAPDALANRVRSFLLDPGRHAV